MNLKSSPLRSLKTRVTLFTLSIFLISMWSLAFYTSGMLREDMQRLLGEQQFSTASFIALEINGELQDRLSALEIVAASIGPVMLGNTAALQLFLEQHTILQSLFNGGTFVTPLDGIATASIPLAAERGGVNYLDRDYVVAAVKEGKATVGRPVMGKKVPAPIVGMAVPIRDVQGKVIGALAGVTDLGQSNFLGKVTANRYGKTGGYLLVAPQYRLVVSATDQSRVMETLPAPGINPMLDRFIRGYEGSAILMNPLGVEVLASAKSVPAAGWYVVALLPTEEAFAPVRAVQQRMLIVTVLLTLLTGGLTWWMLKRQLSPMLAAAKMLTTLSASDQPPPPLPIVRQDEIGQLIGGFNRLLEILGQREIILKQILDTSSVAIFLVNQEGRITQANQRMAEMFDWPLDALEGAEYVSLIHPSEREIGRQKMLDLLASAIPSVDLERLYWRADHTEFWGHLTGQRFIDADGQERGLVGVIADVTVRRRAEEELRRQNHLLSAIFENFPGGISVFDAELRLTAHNNRLKRMLDLPDAVFDKPQMYFEDFIRYNAQRGDYGPGDPEQHVAVNVARARNFQPHTIERMLPNGMALEIRGMPLPEGGFVTVYLDITERKQMEEQVRQLAFYDTLTKLPNRRLLNDRLIQAMATSKRSDCYGALLFLDLDHFKTLNDTLGHDRGDLLLQQVAQRLVTCVREGDTVARLGGDEFVVMLEGLSENPEEAATQAETVGEKILVTLNQPYQLADQENRSTPSIGVTLFGGHQTSIDELLKQADLAMYQSKTAGRNTLRFFDPAMQALVAERAALEADLREALRQQQFTLYYQPQVIGDGRLTGAEALLRWQHPQRGLVSPAEFIALAEETGLILPLGHWVLETACAQLAAWATLANTAHLSMAVNVSAKQLHQGDFVDQVLAVLGRTGANPKKLKLELTESLLVSDVENTIAKMAALKAHGVGFSLDDFGTGYSSLTYLKRLPLDQLKIDQGFVRDILIDPNDAAIAKMVVALAESMGLTVIAEGVEIEAQRDFLARLGCHAYQGYLFSRPLPIDAFDVFARQG